MFVRENKGIICPPTFRKTEARRLLEERINSDSSTTVKKDSNENSRGS
jgi:hypothetical protein